MKLYSVHDFTVITVTSGLAWSWKQRFPGSEFYQEDNKLFYGRLFVDTRMSIVGGKIIQLLMGHTCNENTKATEVIPQSDPGIIEREG